MVFELRVRLPRTTTGEGWVSLELDGLPATPPPDPNAFVVKGGLSSGLIELALFLLLPLSFGSKIPPQNRVFDPCISYQVSRLAPSLYFKFWDPGGHLYYPSP